MRGSLWLALLLLPTVPALALLTALIERSGPIRLRHWVEEAGGRLRRLYENPARFEVFRYLLNLLAKLLPLALFAAAARGLAGAGLGSPLLLAGLGVAAVVGLSELASRSLLGRDPEEALRRLTALYRAVLLAMMPVVWACAPFVRQRQEEPAAESDDEEASEEEVEAFIDVGTREGILEPEDRDLVWGVVDFGDTMVRSVMTPRVDVVAGSVDEPLDVLLDRMLAHAVSRLPLYRGSIDQVVGVLHLRDLVAAWRRDPSAAAEPLATPAMLVPETNLLGDLLKALQARRQQMAIVLNEFGGTEGLVTVEDLVEEIVGEIQDEHDEAEPENHLLADGSLLLDGRASLDALDEFFGWRDGEAAYETVGGLVSSLVGYVPQAGEAIEHGPLRFEIERADERRVLSLRVRRRETVEAADA
ncbi:MAG: hemolysin family protein [Thermoanaerobaculia bacterium]|nr:hemolysin family protein [Thermoanaerobaculia bacterium]